MRKDPNCLFNRWLVILKTIPKKRIPPSFENGDGLSLMKLKHIRPEWHFDQFDLSVVKVRGLQPNRQSQLVEAIADFTQFIADQLAEQYLVELELRKMDRKGT